MRITTRTLGYTTADGLTLQSYLCLPEEAPNGLFSGACWLPRMVGLDDHAKTRPSAWPTGYAALAMDLYGEARLADEAARANEWMMEALSDPAVLTERTHLAQQALASVQQISPAEHRGHRLLLRRQSGARYGTARRRLKAVVSFHGNMLDRPCPHWKVW